MNIGEIVKQLDLLFGESGNSKKRCEYLVAYDRTAAIKLPERLQPVSELLEHSDEDKSYEIFFDARMKKSTLSISVNKDKLIDVLSLFDSNNVRLKYSPVSCTPLLIEGCDVDENDKPIDGLVLIAPRVDRQEEYDLDDIDDDDLDDGDISPIEDDALDDLIDGDDDDE